MTTAEELRKYADKALKEGGIMYFLDEHLDALASRAEAEQAETEKLRRLLQISLTYCANGYCEEGDGCPLREGQNSCRMCAEARELGVEEEE